MSWISDKDVPTNTGVPGIECVVCQLTYIPEQPTHSVPDGGALIPMLLGMAAIGYLRKIRRCSMCGKPLHLCECYGDAA